MLSFSIWLTAVLLYGIFWRWYHNFRGPLTADEIEHYLDAFAKQKNSLADTSQLREFLEADKGEEFVMLNLVELYSEKVIHPETQQPVSAVSLIRAYLTGFMPSLMARAGHPVYSGRKVGRYIDSKNLGEEMDWTMVGSMRYRSRRDLVDLALDPRFLDTHACKFLGMAATYSFPTHTMVGLYLGPSIWVAVVLALLAASSHLLLLLIGA